MNNYVWSASHVSFFPKAMLQDYESAGWNLSDVVDVVDDIFKHTDQCHQKVKFLGLLMACLHGLTSRQCQIACCFQTNLRGLR
ncbi:phage tail protein [Escherichia coli]|nr:phage tail protein [Escherichia coli]